MIWSRIGLGFKLEPTIFQNIDQSRSNWFICFLVCWCLTPISTIFQLYRGGIRNGVSASRLHIPSSETARRHFLQVIEIALFNMTMPMLSLQEPQDTFLSATSSDLNPIEHQWDEIQRRLNEVQPRPQATVAELDASFVRAGIPVEFINGLIY